MRKRPSGSAYIVAARRTALGRVGGLHRSRRLEDLTAPVVGAVQADSGVPPQRVVEIVRDRLLTPVGLRSLGPGHSDYKSKYYGDLRARDAAYHQGTVWGWLIGPFIDAWMRVHPYETDRAREFLAGFEPHLIQTGIGSISEIFDATEPYLPRGCIAQAWSVAEALRVFLKTHVT